MRSASVHLVSSFRNSCLFLLIALAGQALEGPPAALMGRWRSIETSKGGIGFLYSFRENGTVDFSPAALVEMQYRLDGDNLFLPADSNEPAPATKVKFVDADHARLSTEQAGKTSTQELTRKGSIQDPKNLILGEWTSLRKDLGAGIESTEIFYPKGKFLLVIPFIWVHGRWTVTGTTIQMDLPNLKPVQGPFAVEGYTLKLPLGTDRVSRLARY